MDLRICFVVLAPSPKSQSLRMRFSSVLSLASVSGNLIGFALVQALSQGTRGLLHLLRSTDFLIAPTTKISGSNSTTLTDAAVGKDGSCCFVVQSTVSVASWAGRFPEPSKQSSTNRGIEQLVTYTATIFITSVIHYRDTAVTSVETSTSLSSGVPDGLMAPLLAEFYFPYMATKKIKLNGTKTELAGDQMYEYIRCLDDECLTECHTERLPPAS